MEQTHELTGEYLEQSLPAKTDLGSGDSMEVRPSSTCVSRNTT